MRERAFVSLACVCTAVPVALAVSAPAIGMMPTFTHVTTSDTLLAGKNSRGGAWGDFDNDGDHDLYVTVWDGPNQLLRNDGAGVFTNVTRTLGFTPGPMDVDGLPGIDGGDLAALLSNWGGSGLGDLNGDMTVDGQDLAILLTGWATVPFVALEGEPPSYSGRAVWGDIDNDGDLDLYWTNSGANVLLRNDGAAGFTDISSAPINHGGLGRAAAFMDLNNDRLLDVYVSSTTAQRFDATNRMLLGVDGTSFLDQTSPGAADDAVGRGVAWADYDNDGDMDLYVANGSPGGSHPDPADNTRNALLRNDNGTLVNATVDPLDDLGNSRGVAWGDYDNDGDMDLYVVNLPVGGIGGANRLFRNDLGAGFVDVSDAHTGATTATRDCAWVDADNDGDLDLYIGNALGSPRLLRNDGGTFVDDTPAGLATTGELNGASWADYDGDGDLDVYVTRKVGGNVLARNDLATGAHWLIVRLQGVQSNSDGYGARISATTGALTQIREIAPGSGYMVQHMIPAHFGLGAASVVDTLEIRWPSGVVQTLQNVAVDQVLVVTEESP